MKPRYSGRVELLALALVLAATAFMRAIPSAPVMAQATTGTVKGTVVDQNGAVIPEAIIVAKNQDTGVSTPPFKSTKDGVFAITNLNPGKYTVSVESQSFKRGVYTDVEVRLGQDTTLATNLQPGGVTETVTVTAGAETAIQTETSQISASFETRKVAELPSNAAGGGIDTLALLAPGVVPGFGNVNSNGMTLSVNGQRSRSNNFTIDGTDNNDLSLGGPNLFVSNQDQVQEFQIITNNYSAQYGRNQGAVVNIVTKGGTNEIHGSVFEYHRNSKSLDALNNFERRRGDENPSFFLSNVFGATAGGPIKKDKIFLFGTYQGVRQRETASVDSGSLAILPAEFSRLTAAFPGNDAIAVVTKQSPFALTGLGTVTPRKDRDLFTTYPDGTPAPAGAQDFVRIGGVDYAAAFPHRDFAAPFNQYEYSVRGDANITEKNTVNARYIYQKGTSGNALGGTGGFTGDLPASSRNLSGTYSRTLSSRSTNEFRATYQKLDVIFGGGCQDLLAGCIPHPDDLGNTFTNITFGIRGSTGTLLQSIGPATNLPQGRIVEVYQFTDNFSVTLGRHQIVTGVDVRRLVNSVPFLPNLNGQFRFPDADRLAANAPDRVILGAGEPTIRYTETDQFYFFQDDWKIRENLSLNIGVRYEHTGQPINVLNTLSALRENNPDEAFYRQNLPIEARTVSRLPADNNNLAPRIGFAYTPRVKSGLFGALLGDGDTVFRGGYSIAYDPAFYNILLNVSTSAPAVFLNTIPNNASLGSPTFRLPANPTGDVVRGQLSSFLQRNTFDPRLLNQTIVADDFHSPYAQQWSFGFQRQLNRDNVAEARYVGGRGVGLFQSINRNPFLGVPGSATNGGLVSGFRSAGGGGTVFTFPAFPSALGGLTPLSCTNTAGTLDNEGVCNGRILPQGLVRSRENTGFSTYHSLQTRYNGRLFKQLTLGFAYTFSKALDNASEIFAFGESAFAANPLNIGKPEKSISGFDRPHAISFNFIHDLPLFKEQKGFLGKVLGGFQLNGTYVIASGRPFTVTQFSGFGFGLPSYQDNLFQSTFAGFDAVRPFLANPKAPRREVAITDVDASYYGFFGVDADDNPLPFVPSPTGYYSLNVANTQTDANGNSVLTPVNLNDVRYILNGPGAAARFGNSFGNIPRNGERGPRLNQANFGIFKNTKFKERFNLQFRAEFFNIFNHPNAGYGVAGLDSLYDFDLEDAGTTFNDRGEAELSSRRIQFGLRFVF